MLRHWSALEREEECGEQTQKLPEPSQQEGEVVSGGGQNGIDGIYHRFSQKYFDWYVAELAWRADCRQVSIRGYTFQIERTQSGLKRAKSEGKALGRPSTLSEKQKQDVRDDLTSGMSVSAVARKFATSRQTIMRVRDESSRSIRP